MCVTVFERLSTEAKPAEGRPWPSDDDDGLEAHSHHDKFPPWWVFVRDDDGGNLSVTKSHH